MHAPSFCNCCGTACRGCCLFEPGSGQAHVANGTLGRHHHVGTGPMGLGGISGPMDVLFPSRADSAQFRNQLETKYQTGLGRAASMTSVDPEGEVVWTQEYIRYRVNGCDHPTAVQRVMAQIDGNPPGGICAENRDFVILFPPRDHTWISGVSWRPSIRSRCSAPGADLRRHGRQRDLDAGIPALPRQRVRSQLRRGQGECADRRRRRAGDVRASLPLFRESVGPWSQRGTAKLVV